MSNHTPGPWEVNEAHGYTVMGEGEEVASTHLTPVGDAAALANARLIAAAPQLLDSLKSLAKAVAAARPVEADEWGRCLAAIAKAEDY